MIGSRLATSHYWSLINVYGTIGFSLVFVMILSRMLGPEVFGLVAKYTVVMVVCSALVEAGLLTILLRKPFLSMRTSQRAHSCMVARSIVAWAITVICVSWIGPKKDLWVILTLSLLIITSGLQAVPVMLIVRQMKFKQKAWISAVSAFTGGLLSVVLAELHADARALVAGQLVNAFMVFYLCQRATHLRLQVGGVFWSRRRFHLKSIIITSTNCLERILTSIYYWSAGLNVGLSEVGAISRVDVLRNASITAISKSISRVTIANHVMLKSSAHGEFLSLIIFSTVSYLIGIGFLSLFSATIINLLFGAGWEKAAELLAPVLFNGAALSLVTMSARYLFVCQHYSLVGLVIPFLVLGSLFIFILDLGASTSQNYTIASCVNACGAAVLIVSLFHIQKVGAEN